MAQTKVEVLQTNINQTTAGPAEWRAVRNLADLVIELNEKLDALTVEVAKIPKV